MGKLEDLKIPRDREENFKTKLIEPYKRRDISLDELIFGMFARGMSARAIAQTFEVIFELKYSPSTISQISQITSEEIKKWKDRSLKRRYPVIMLDGMYLSVRRDTVEKEVVLFVLDFEVNPGEGAESWGELIKRLYERGINEVLLFVADRIPGLEQKIKEYFPKADFQCCVLHKVRNTLNKVRVKDRKKTGKGFKEDISVFNRKRSFKGI
ncbi:MAG: transposase [Thermodesulfobacterium sp.]|nr:transposase [Thermodesulfobacterium sp.]